YTGQSLSDARLPQLLLCIHAFPASLLSLARAQDFLRRLHHGPPAQSDLSSSNPRRRFLEEHPFPRVPHRSLAGRFDPPSLPSLRPTAVATDKLALALQNATLTTRRRTPVVPHFPLHLAVAHFLNTV